MFPFKIKTFLIFISLFATINAPHIKASSVKLSQIETYLNTLHTLQANFEQWDQNGAYTTGKLYLQKPGKIRLNYNLPSKLVILGDGQTLFFMERDTGDLSHTPIANSPASFLLAEKTNLHQDFTIHNFTYNAQRVEITLQKKNNPDLGSLTLVFRRMPTLDLVKWIVTDPQDKNIIVKLNTIKKGTKKSRALSPTLFDSSILFG